MFHIPATRGLRSHNVTHVNQLHPSTGSPGLDDFVAARAATSQMGGEEQATQLPELGIGILWDPDLGTSQDDSNGWVWEACTTG